ncbi:hypothetical protein CBM2633_B60263 [Cupriavidus taiwanensis]|nr:hypothetical protein CBM2633_B60263 [Cupriavidus taiwanensis]
MVGTRPHPGHCEALRLGPEAACVIAVWSAQDVATSSDWIMSRAGCVPIMGTGQSARAYRKEPTPCKPGCCFTPLRTSTPHCRSSPKHWDCR